ncbi:phosphatidate cytidylyltransferase [Mycoplasma testudineum]|uniref:Phosphatidate cytidylyltransferase n=1 Tax=Mycoplasma testudineum TaxID=244584 RepID=A0A4R6IJA7_9MOLU|nr:phosphatidate cytidylyltransferase [Mycoplasma testudineum]OYD26427.1 hypothetical protein CG473_04035 [Mycoplasma testudineum]TDO22102.1 phosphatidate cytidylyltransferase [Mycoplasma testudineum]
MNQIFEKIPLKRIVPAIIFMVVLFSILFISIFTNGNNEAYAIALRSLILVVVTITISLLIYELLKSFEIHWSMRILFIALAITSIIVSDKTQTIQNSLINNPPVNQMAFRLKSDVLADWTMYAILGAAFVSLIGYYFIFNNQLKNSELRIEEKRLMAPKIIFLNSIAILFSYSLIIIFYRGIWLTATLQWEFLILLFGIPIISDTSAFLVGSWIGKKIIKRPFAPIISPNKSFEGFFAGLLTSIIFVQAIYWGLDLNSRFISISQTDNVGMKVNSIILLSLVAPLVSPIGDLWFSYLKRSNGIKDYSNLLGGHGGMLDRLDSTLFVNFIIMLAFAFY